MLCQPDGTAFTSWPILCAMVSKDISEPGPNSGALLCFPDFEVLECTARSPSEEHKPFPGEQKSEAKSGKDAEKPESMDADIIQFTADQSESKKADSAGTDAHAPGGSGDSEFPEAGTVRRQKEELERRDSQRKDKDASAKLVRRVSRKGRRFSLGRKLEP